MTQSNLDQAFSHGAKVAAYVLGSAVIPCLLTMYSGNAYWLLLTPVINSVAAGLTKWSGLVKAQLAASQGK